MRWLNEGLRVPQIKKSSHDLCERYGLQVPILTWGPPVPADVGDVRFPDFEQQCEAFLAAEPLVASSIMGLFSEAFVSRLKIAGIRGSAHESHLFLPDLKGIRSGEVMSDNLDDVHALLSLDLFERGPYIEKSLPEAVIEQADTQTP